MRWQIWAPKERRTIATEKALRNGALGRGKERGGSQKTNFRQLSPHPAAAWRSAIMLNLELVTRR